MIALFEDLLVEDAFATGRQRAPAVLDLPLPGPRLGPEWLTPRSGPLLFPPEALGVRAFLVLNRFPFNGVSLSRHHRQQIDRAVRFLAGRSRPGRPGVHIRLVGHADLVGPARFNDALGLRRAGVVREAFMASIARQASWLRARTRFDVETRGERQPVAPGNTADGRARNRRVSIYVAYQGAIDPRRPGVHGAIPGIVPVNVPVTAARPPSPRTCCMLAPTQSPLGARTSNSNLDDPASLGTHRSANEVTGIVYHPLYGFLDLGHLRDHCDLTRFVYNRIAHSNGAPGTIPTSNGQARITTRIPPERWMLAARSIANDDGVGHEISSYNEMFPGGHNSSFSPEDLVSNFIGTRLAEIAMQSPGSFEAGATFAIDNLMFGSADRAGSRQAFDNINGCWVQFSSGSSIMSDGYLRRRNFTRTPWKAPGVRNAVTPSFVFDSLAAAETHYQYTHTAGVTIPKASFPTEITRIRADARTRYGSDFDQPTPCAVAP